MLYVLSLSLCVQYKLARVLLSRKIYRLSREVILLGKPLGTSAASDVFVVGRDWTFRDSIAGEMLENNSRAVFLTPLHLAESRRARA